MTSMKSVCCEPVLSAGGIVRAAWYTPPPDGTVHDADLAIGLMRLLQDRSKQGFWKCCSLLRQQRPGWNHKRIYRVYKTMKLNLRRTARRRLHIIVWAQQHGIEHPLSEPERPMQHGYIESFNGKFRDECLNERWPTSSAQTRKVILIGDATTARSGHTAVADAPHQRSSPPTTEHSKPTIQHPSTLGIIS